jgi:hypothetical protein
VRLCLVLLALAGAAVGWRLATGAPRQERSVEIPTRPDALVDGHCTEYDALDAALTLSNGDGAAVYLRSTADDLFVCFRDLPLTENGTGQLPYAALYLDVNHDGGALPAADDLRVRITLDSPSAALEVGDGAGGWVPDSRAGWSAASVRRICGRALCADAEYRVAASLIDNWASEWGLALVHHWVNAPGDDYAWPWSALPGVPSTWGAARRVGAPTSTPAPGSATATFTPRATNTAPATDTATGEATPSSTVDATATLTSTVVSATATASPTPTETGTALPPVQAALELASSSAPAGGSVGAWGIAFGCLQPGVVVAWPDGTRLARARGEPFRVTLTLPLAPPGDYRLSAACADGSGRSASAILTLRSAPPPPAVNLVPPAAPIYAGQVTAWSADGTAGLARFDWDFGDGRGLVHQATSGHVYDSSGSYTVTLTAYDGAGRSDVASSSVTVLEAVAAGRYRVQPDGWTVAFLNQSRGPFTRQRWDFGDGSTSSRSNDSHRYALPGTYQPRLIASYAGPGGLSVERSAELGPLVIGDGAAPNLALAGLEVVQVNLADGLLAARRRTVARVHVRREGGLDGLAGRYDVRLRAFRAGGAALAGSGILRQVAQSADPSTAADDVVTLELPAEWTVGRSRQVTDPLLGTVTVSDPITLTADVRPLAELAENKADNMLSRPVTFHPTVAQDLLLTTPGAVSDVDLAQLVGELRRMWPLAGSDLGLWLPLGGQQVSQGPSERRAGAPAALDAAALAWRTGGRAHTGLFGVALSPDLDEAAADPCAYALPAGGAGFWLAADADQPAHNLVRTLARALGLPNAPGGQPAEGPLDPSFPTGDGTLDADGLDLADLSRRARADHHDFLSPAACAKGDAWWSGHGYGRLVARLARADGGPGAAGSVTTWRANRPSAQDEPPEVASDYAAIAGVIRAPDSGGQRVTVDPIFHDDHRHAPEDDAPGRGDWSITLLDDAGQVLFTRYMAISYPRGAAGRPQPRAFFQVLPWHAFTRRVILREGTTLHWDQAVPAAWPNVHWLTPGAGDRWQQGAAYLARWAADDPGGHPLAFQLDLSADDGRSWRPVGSTLDRTEVTLQSAYLSGCETCRLRVRASNGLLVSEAVGDRFAIEAPAPVARIVAPADGALLPANEPIWLDGLAYDATDGPLGAGQVSWRSNLDGTLGLDLTIQTLLSVGTHTLHFSALNSAGRASTEEITLRVVPGRREHTIWVPRVELP